MKTFLVLLLFCAAAQARPMNRQEKTYAETSAKGLAAEIEKGGVVSLAQRSDQALDALVGRAIAQLRKRGHQAYADKSAMEWQATHQGTLTRTFQTGFTAIGDHPPLLEWLAKFYDQLEARLGRLVCKQLHLSDIKTFNFCIPVVFNPCHFDMGAVESTRRDEYINHFASDRNYYGLMPVVTYWVVNLGCLVGTSGIASMLCGPVAGWAQSSCNNWIAPGLAAKIFDRACK
jgi:hypothetical protein